MWGEWKDVTQCNATCNEGFINRTRRCIRNEWDEECEISANGKSGKVELITQKCIIKPCQGMLYGYYIHSYRYY